MIAATPSKPAHGGRLARACLAPLIAVVLSTPLILLAESATSFDIVSVDFTAAPWLSGTLTAVVWLLLAYVCAGVVGSPVAWLVARVVHAPLRAAIAGAVLADAVALALFLWVVSWTLPLGEVAWLAALGGLFFAALFGARAWLGARAASHAA